MQTNDPIALLTKSFEEHSETVTEKLKEQEGKAADLSAIVFDIEQKLARRGGGGSSTPSSLGQEFVRTKGADLEALKVNRGRVAMEMKATITSATTDADGSAGSLVVPTRDQTVGMPQRRMTIRDLLTTVQVESGSVEFARQVGRPDGAAPVAEGAKKQESGMQFELAQVPIRTIAHWVKASRQVLDDAPQLRDLIDSELRYGLALVEEDQLLHGDGTGQNLEGMVPQASAFDDPLELVDPTPIDVLGSAILQASLTDLPPDGVVVHPADWWRMRLLKGEDGKYILGDPMSALTPMLFGLPVVPTPAMDAGEFLVGNFAAQTLYDRWSARVEVGFEGEDFVRNLVTLLAEERIGFAAKQPQALIHGSFTTEG